MAKVLLATDGSDLALRSARRAVDLLGTDHEFVVLSAIHPPLPVGDTAVAIDAVPTPLPDPETEAIIEEEQQSAADDAIAELISSLGLSAEAVERRVEHGDAGSVICAVAEDIGADVVVIGSHGKGFLKRVLMGSVSHHVLHHAPCPVLLLRERAEDDAAEH